MTTDDQVASAKASVNAIDDRLQFLLRRRKVLDDREYRETIHAWLETEIEVLRGRLERPDLQPGETSFARGCIAAHRAMLSLFERTVKEMETLAEKAAGLQEKLERWHTRGRSELESAVETASRIAKPRTRSRR